MKVASVAALMAPDGGFITGSDFLMDGGVTAAYCTASSTFPLRQPQESNDDHLQSHATKIAQGVRGCQRRRCRRTTPAPHQEVIFLDETDPISSPMKAKGVAELGICGVAAAVANAIYNATNVQVRDYPITLDKLLAKLPEAA